MIELIKRIDTLTAERDAAERDRFAARQLQTGLTNRIKSLEAERDALKAALAALRPAIEEIARQHTYDECDEDEQENGDVVGAYDYAIRRARAALERHDSGGGT